MKPFIGCKTVKNVQIDPQTMEIWATELNVLLPVSEYVSESVSDTLVSCVSNKYFRCCQIDNCTAKAQTCASNSTPELSQNVFYKLLWVYLIKNTLTKLFNVNSRFFTLF